MCGCGGGRGGVTSSFECNEKPLGTVRDDEFSELLCDYQLLKTDSTARS